VTEAISGSILRLRQLYQTENLSDDPMRIKDVHGMDHLGPAIFTPVLSGDHPIGLLLAARRKGKHVTPFTPEATRMIITASEMLGNAINRVRLHAETMRRLDHLQTLRALDQVIASSLDLRITLNILLTHTMTQLNVDAADVFLLHPYQQTLQFAAGQGFRSRAIESAEIHLYDAFAGRSVMERRIVQIFDDAQVADNKPFARLWLEENFSSYICVPLIAKGEVKGVLEVYHRSQFTPDPEWLEFLETLAGQAAITIDNAQMFDNLQRVNMELAIAYDATIEGWSRALDLRDKETEGHTQRVTELTVLLAKTMGIKDKEILYIRRGALLHDIGKMGIPDHILLKEGPLTEKEWEIMYTHPALAFEMLQPIRYLHQSLDIPYSHHEKWDGTGYPRGLNGEQIPLVARIFAVADVWDAVTSVRPYRKAWTKRKAMAYIKEQSGKHFDPRVVEVFLKLIK
jgi:putative nucleotidyltransferase with HDIG domain